MILPTSKNKKKQCLFSILKGWVWETVISASIIYKSNACVFFFHSYFCTMVTKHLTSDFVFWLLKTHSFLFRYRDLTFFYRIRIWLLSLLITITFVRQQMDFSSTQSIQKVTSYFKLFVTLKQQKTSLRFFSISQNDHRIFKMNETSTSIYFIIPFRTILTMWMI